MLLHWGAFLILSCSIFAITHAATETDKDAETLTLLSLEVEQGQWNAGGLPYDSIPSYHEPSGSDNPESLPANILQGSDPVTTENADSFYSVKSRFNDFDIAESLYYPPDPHGAAGRDVLVAIINSNMSARTKDGGLVFKSTLKAFFSQGLGRDLTSASVFDPKILYDASEDRFVAVALFGSVSQSSILLAVSKNGSPATPNATDWNFGEINSLVSGNWADYPGFALCAQAIYITANMFSASRQYQETRLWIVTKTPFYNSGTVQQPAGSPFSLSALEPKCFTTQPAATTGVVGAYLLSFGGGGIYYSGTNTAVILVFKVSDPIGTPTITHQFVDIGPLEALADVFSDLPDAPQKGSALTIETNNKRMLQAVLFKNSIWGVMTVKLQGKATAYWVKLDASNPTIQFVDKGPIVIDNISPGASTYYPSIAINVDGIVAFGFAASGPNLFAGSYVTVRDDVFDPLSTVRDSQVASPGTSSYFLVDGNGRNRWGDYTATVVDPVDVSCFWAYNQYAAGTTTWITAWHHFCVEGHRSAAPSGLSSRAPSALPSSAPSALPSSAPSALPSPAPSPKSSGTPNKSPSARPSLRPSPAPSRSPTPSGGLLQFLAALVAAITSIIVGLVDLIFSIIFGIAGISDSSGSAADANSTSGRLQS